MDDKDQWSKELDGKELHGAWSLVASTISSRDYPLFPAHHNKSEPNCSSIEILCDIMLVLKIMVRFLVT